VSSSPTDEQAAAAAGLVQVTMPQMGVSVAEGTIIEWRKRPGDWVEADEPVCDVTTDKVDVEIPSPAGGRLERILVEAGETVPVGTPLAEIDAAARPGEAHPEEGAGDAAPGRHDMEPAPDRSHYYSPVVRRIAESHGIDLSRVEGTGVGGRVRKRDVLAFLETHEGADRAEPALHLDSPYRPEEPLEEPPREAAPPAAAATGSAGEPLAPGRREPMSPMRIQIARHMVESRRTAAHCTTVVEVDMSRVAERRAALKEMMSRRGVPLTYLAFVARAAVIGLEEHPALNASVEGDEIVHHEEVNLGVAVALDDGLIVPVIRHAQRLSLEGMAAAIADLARRARERELEPDDVHGGTFTITNPGNFGTILATPIINQPQVAILDLEAVVKRPVVVEGPDGADAIAVRPITYLCMSWDHRALDGADAARFLATVKGLLEAGKAPE
jgi:pyruvate/2-oxoglutarate dehydrogenase complex dihydrolipoamide acyltransferase (E2) component